MAPGRAGMEYEARREDGRDERDGIRGRRTEDRRQMTAGNWQEAAGSKENSEVGDQKSEVK